MGIAGQIAVEKRRVSERLHSVNQLMQALRRRSHRGKARLSVARPRGRNQLQLQQNANLQLWQLVLLQCETIRGAASPMEPKLAMQCQTGGHLVES